MGKAIYSMQAIPHTKVSIFVENKSVFAVSKLYFRLRIRQQFCILQCNLSMCGNGQRYSKCGIKLLLNCLPAHLVPIYREPVPIYREMYVKISNVSRTRIPAFAIAFIICCFSFQYIQYSLKFSVLFQNR